MKHLACLALLAASAVGHAGITWFDHPGFWAGAAGPPSYLDTFDGFAVDTPFTTGPVASAAGTFIQESTEGNTFRNEIDVPPLSFLDNNGTKHASLFTNAFEAGLGTNVRLTFHTAHMALGFLTWEAATAEGATVEVYDGLTLLGSHDLTGGTAEFTGFVLDGGMTATSILFRSTSTFAAGTGEGFGFDDVVGVHAPVPEPATLALGTAGLAWAARRRRFARS